MENGIRVTERHFSSELSEEFGENYICKKNPSNKLYLCGSSLNFDFTLQYFILTLIRDSLNTKLYLDIIVHNKCSVI